MYRSWAIILSSTASEVEEEEEEEKEEEEDAELVAEEGQISSLVDRGREFRNASSSSVICLSSKSVPRRTLSCRRCGLETTRHHWKPLTHKLRHHPH